MTGPDDPVTAAAVSAAHIHELYLTWIKAGFTTEQAMRMVCALITAHAQAAPD